MTYGEEMSAGTMSINVWMCVDGGRGPGGLWRSPRTPEDTKQLPALVTLSGGRERERNGLGECA